MTPTHDTCKFCTHEYELQESTAHNRDWFCSEDCEVDFWREMQDWTDS